MGMGHWGRALLSALKDYLTGLLPEVLLLIHLHRFVAYVAAQARPRLGSCS
jgi:hypothetical protein